jgi:hypothetical protein
VSTSAAVNCPACGGDQVAVFVRGYLLPSDDLLAREARGEAIIAGCVVSSRSPSHRCRGCGTEWQAWPSWTSTATPGGHYPIITNDLLGVTSDDFNDVSDAWSGQGTVRIGHLAFIAQDSSLRILTRLCAIRAIGLMDGPRSRVALDEIAAAERPGTIVATACGIERARFVRRWDPNRLGSLDTAERRERGLPTSPSIVWPATAQHRATGSEDRDPMGLDRPGP